MSEENRKREAAIRLFGALSGVDEEYLAACEADAAVKKRQERSGMVFGGLNRFVRKYGTAVAAVLCIAVLGASVAGYRAANRIAGGSPAKSADPADMAFQEAAEGAVEEESLRETTTDDVADAAGTELLTPAAGSPESDGTDSMSSGSAIRSQTNGMESMSDKEDLKKKLGCLPGDDDGEIMTLEQVRALDVVGGYFPAVLPESGAISVLYGRDIPGQEKITMGWNLEPESSSGWFYVLVENLGSELPDRTEALIADVTKPETYKSNPEGVVFWESDFEERLVEECLIPNWDNSDGLNLPGGTFSVLCEEEGNYVLVTFYGEGTAEEVWEMMRSVRAK